MSDLTPVPEDRVFHPQPGWLEDAIAESVAVMESLPPGIRAALDPPYLARNRRQPQIPREALIEAANALVAARDLTFDPHDSRIPDALETSDWCLECVGSDAAAMAAAHLVAAILWPLAYRAGREDAAEAIEQDPNSRDCFWDTADSWWNGYDAAKERAAALARGQHTQDGGER